ncbi:hypothetical protein ACHWQZ_G012990 [Mnemiopsis leidyi]
MVLPRFRSSSASDATTKLTISAPIIVSDPFNPVPSQSSPASTLPTKPGSDITSFQSTDEVLNNTPESSQSGSTPNEKPEPTPNPVPENKDPASSTEDKDPVSCTEDKDPVSSTEDKDPEGSTEKKELVSSTEDKDPEGSTEDKEPVSSTEPYTETDSPQTHTEITSPETPHFACPSCKQPFKRASSAGSRIPATVPEETVARGSHVCPSVEDRLDKLTGQVKELAKENRELKLEIIKIYSILCQRGQTVVNSEPGPNTLRRIRKIDIGQPTNFQVRKGVLRYIDFNVICASKAVSLILKYDITTLSRPLSLSHLEL